jgi:hypothetical protein
MKSKRAKRPEKKADVSRGRRGSEQSRMIVPIDAGRDERRRARDGNRHGESDEWEGGGGRKRGN